VTVTGVADTPVVTAFIPDITKGLPSNSFTCAFCTFPGGEPPPKAFDDNTGSKYLSSRGAGTDVIVDAGIDYVITALSFVTANDDDGRDPVKVSVFGSATGSSGPWSEIKTGLEISPPVARASAFGPYSFDNTAAYRYFKIVFDQLRRTGSDFQIAEISIRGTTPSGVARYTTGAPNTIIGSGISLFDDGDARTATASLPNPGSMPGDRLGLAPGTAAGVTATWDATTRTLTVTANSQADLADALKKLTFVSSEVDPTPAGLTRQISLTVTDDKGATSAVAPLSVSIQPAATPFSDPGTNELPSQDPGAFRVFQDGIPLPDVNVEVQNNSALVMSNADFEIRLSAQCTTGCAIQTDSSGRPVIELESSGSALIEGLGFQPGSFIDVWLFSTPTYLGQLQVDDDGKFSGELALPVIAAGSHTLQVNGTSADGKSRSANLGVIVRGTSSGFEFDYELPEQPTTLPDTGGSPTLGPWAAAFVLAGGFLLSIRRRRTL
jgi:LPXTG-motif cell wall-anchored protein